MKKIKLNSFNKIECLEGLAKLENNSIDMILTSPPYDDMRTYAGGNNSPNFRIIGKEISKKLKIGGMAVVIINDKTKYVKSMTTFRLAIDWHDNTNLKMWEDVIYYRDGNPGAYWSKRFRRDHEYILIFIKTASDDKTPRPQYFNKEHMKIDSKHAGVTWGGSRTTSNGKVEQRKNITVGNKKCCGTVMKYATSNSEGNKLKNAHPAPFPDKLAEDLILAFTKKGMTVVDTFMGSGTTGIMAYKNKRNFIGFDLSKEYIDISRKRFKKETIKWD